MIRAALIRRLERLEDERIPDGQTRIINVEYLDSNGSPTGGYQVVIPPLPSQRRSGAGCRGGLELARASPARTSQAAGAVLIRFLALQNKAWLFCFGWTTLEIGNKLKGPG
jgi:hypothetical protein